MSELRKHTVLAGRYAIDYVIGAGGFGITYHAYRIEDGREVAIKEFFISGHCVRRSDNTTVTFQDLSREKFNKYRMRFHQEAQMLQQMNNDHLVNVMQVFDENGTSYMVMDYIKGETLQKRIERRGRMSYDDAVNCIGQLCDAVGYVHKRNILHRDIKPDNIMITPQNKIILIDFGSARAFVHDAVQNHTTIVTHGYAPMEQYSQGFPVGNYTDLYAVGGVFYFLLTGQKPPAAPDRAIHDQLIPPIAIRQDVTPAANYTILKALNTDSKARYQTAQQLLCDLLGGDPGPGPGPGPDPDPDPTSTVLGFILAFIPFLCIIGLILSVQGVKKNLKYELAVAGTVISSMMTFASFIIFINAVS